MERDALCPVPGTVIPVRSVRGRPAERGVAFCAMAAAVWLLPGAFVALALSAALHGTVLYLLPAVMGLGALGLGSWLLSGRGARLPDGGGARITIARLRRWTTSARLGRLARVDGPLAWFTEGGVYGGLGGFDGWSTFTGFRIERAQQPGLVLVDLWRPAPPSRSRLLARTLGVVLIAASVVLPGTAGVWGLLHAGLRDDVLACLLLAPGLAAGIAAAGWEMRWLRLGQERQGGRSRCAYTFLVDGRAFPPTELAELLREHIGSTV